MRWVYCSSGRFGAQVLEGMLERGLPPSRVYTLGDRRLPRGGLGPVPAKRVALKHRLEVLALDEIDAEEALLKEDALIVACDIGFIFPPRLVRTQRCLNLHPSLLPRWRGPAPIFWTIRSGDEESGVSLFWMDEGIDTGRIVLQERISVPIQWSYADLEKALAEKAISALLEVFSRSDLPPGRPQEGEPSYARKLARDLLRIDWNSPAKEVYNLVRAGSPYWGAWTSIAGIELKIWWAEVGKESLPPGEVFLDKKRLMIGTADRVILPLRLQPAGKRVMAIEEFLAGYSGKLEGKRCE